MQLLVEDIMLVSICIPTCNRPGLVRQAIDSARAQTYRSIEIIVSDDSTNKDTEQALTDLIRPGIVRYVHNNRPLGQAGNINQLFDLSRGELLLLLHDDDLLLPESVADLAECFAASLGVTSAYGKQYVIEPDGVIDEAKSEALNVGYHRTTDRAGRQKSALFAGLTGQFPNDGYLVRTDVARAVRYRTGSAVGDACDFDFGLRLAAAADGFYFLDKYTAKDRMTIQSISTGNNYTNLTFDLLANAELPEDLEDVRQTQKRKYSRPAVTKWLRVGNRRSALRVYLSSAYGWRQRASAIGLLHLGLLLCPSDLTGWLMTRARLAHRWLSAHATRSRRQIELVPGGRDEVYH
jgi:glycosyltransferase involved in cell wall biosynthesis